MSSDKESGDELANFESASASCAWLLGSWTTRVREDTDCEEESWPTVTLSVSGRSAVWRLCCVMKAHAGGTPALAARLLERYLAVHARYTLAELASAARTSGEDVASLWSLARQRNLERLPLVLMACVQIAGKMTGVNAVLTAKRARAAFTFLKQEYSVEDVIAAEHAVFAILEYRVPLWTSVEAAELLAAQADVLKSYIKAIAASVRLAELARAELERRVRWAGGLGEGGGTVVTSLYLAAGAVAAGVRLAGGGDGSALLGKLATLTGAPQALLRCIVDVIVTLALE